MVAVGYAGYKLSKRDVERVEEYTGQDADELTDEQLEQAMDQLGIEKDEAMRIFDDLYKQFDGERRNLP